MIVRLKLVRIGNSKGIRLPQAFIQRHHLGDEIILRETKTGLLIGPAGSGKLSFDESFAAMAKDRKASVEAREWAESSLSDGLQHEPW